MASAVPTDRPITRDDLRTGFAGLQGEVEEQVDSARTYLIAAGMAAVAAVAVLAWALGRRRGKQEKTLVEIRRV